MLDHNGHVKLVDFGLSKQVEEKDSLTHSFVGSDGYIAPEMKLKKGHNYLNDVYAVGVLLYEVLHCSLPFNKSQRSARKFEQIAEMHEGINFKAGLSADARDLISQLICLAPEKRLDGGDDIMSILFHPWFRDIREEICGQKAIDSPIKLDLTSYQFETALLRFTEEVATEIREDTEDRRFNSHARYESFEFNSPSNSPSNRNQGTSFIDWQGHGVNTNRNTERMMYEEEEEGSISEHNCYTPNQRKNVRIFKNKTKQTRDSLSTHIHQNETKDNSEPWFFSFLF